MAFIVVRGPSDSRFLPTVERYLYAGQKIVSEPVLNEFGSAMVIVDCGFSNAQYIADRFASSGSFGATAFPDIFAAMDYVESER